METSILLVDQESILVGPLQREFGQSRLLLRTASSIESAQRLLDDLLPEVIIVDADIPEAIDFIVRLRSVDKPFIIIGLTNSAKTRTRLQALGLETIILKREGPEPVVNAVRHYADADAPSPQSNNPEVLVVDDEREFLTLFSKMLNLWGYRPWVAADGEEALALIGRRPSIAVVLLDVRLPGRGGMEVLKEMRERNPRTGVIMLSALSDREIARQAIKMGAFDYVTKPPDFPTLQSTIIACLTHLEYQSQSWWKKLMG
jgi:DNA-binding NtrC family response regulator